MKIKKIIKNNLLGFILGAILFGVISTVVATTYASSTVAYTTSANNNVETVEDAVIDLQDKILGYPLECYNGVCGKVSYRYWNDDFANNNYGLYEIPTTTYATRAALETAYGSNNFADSPVYIRSVLIDGNVVGHQTCLWNNSKELCLSNGYWAGTLGTNSIDAGTQTKIKLQRDMQNAFGVTIQDASCYISNSDARCDIGDFHITARYNGTVSSGARPACVVDNVGTASCTAPES